MSKSTAIITDFFLGGTIIALSGFFIRINKAKLGGFIYGALPIGFVYLYILAFVMGGETAAYQLSREVLISTIFFVMFILTAYISLQNGILISISFATFVFFVSCWIYLSFIIGPSIPK